MDAAFNRLQEFLDRKVREYEQPRFIVDDPVSVPHRFSRKQDIEIAGLFAALFAWGQRTTIIRKSNELMARMDGTPHDFIINHRESDLKSLVGFCHRTFNDTDLLYFVSFLRYHYRQHDSLETAFTREAGLKKIPVGHRVEQALNRFYHHVFSLDDVPQRTRKHLAAPSKNSACKRLNMYLRWMVRSPSKGVDFGIWKQLKPADLICPLDLHVARVARRYGMITRPMSDWKAAIELTEYLRKMNPRDPVRYDFALFALGVIEKY